MDNKVSIFSFEDTRVAFEAKTNKELKQAYFLFSNLNNTFLVALGTLLLRWILKLHLPLKNLIENTLFQQFCGGESIRECESTVRHLANYHIRTILDYSVEGEKSKKGFDQTEKELLQTIQKAATNPSIPFSVFKVSGIGPVHVLEKLQQGHALTAKEQEAYKLFKMRFENLCQTAAACKVRILIDAEDSWYQQPVDELAFEMMEKYNKDAAIVYNTYQMYLRNKLEQLKSDCERAKEKGYRFGVKLVRGAYMEKERARANKLNYPDPIQPDKQQSDEAFNAALKYCVGHKETISLCAGTHNEDSSYYLAKLMNQYSIHPSSPEVYFAQLYGMGDHISYNLAKAGYNVVKYVPFGPVKKVIPYLIRRVQENTSVAGQSSRELLLIKKELHRRKTGE
ncbi:proline dehydrogenase family protein [Rapidithrix thailandica]|uniref:Proline dehydrogenase family protein n=1 Tax=Rapidithrix thailandica TaxID=413964 RepID=A0AAW9SCE4_9BACT